METNFRCECHQCESFRANPPSQFQHQKECECRHCEHCAKAVCKCPSGSQPSLQEKKECCPHGVEAKMIYPCNECIAKLNNQPPPSPKPTEKCGCHGPTPDDPYNHAICSKHRTPSESILSPSEQSRITQIRANLEIFQEKGMDTSSWESTFFLELIEKLQKEIKSEK